MLYCTQPQRSRKGITVDATKNTCNIWELRKWSNEIVPIQLNVALLLSTCHTAYATYWSLCSGTKLVSHYISSRRELTCSESLAWSSPANWMSSDWVGCRLLWGGHTPSERAGFQLPFHVSPVITITNKHSITTGNVVIRNLDLWRYINAFIIIIYYV